GESRPWYARTEDLPALERAGRRRSASAGTTLLSPFDSFLWHRERVHRLWGYFYRIEIYVPGHKRQHGYYSLPILHDGQLLGRVDLKSHRERGVLEARHVHFERWFAAGAPAPPVGWGPVGPGAAWIGTRRSRDWATPCDRWPGTSARRASTSRAPRRRATARRSPGRWADVGREATCRARLAGGPGRKWGPIAEGRALLET